MSAVAKTPGKPGSKAGQGEDSHKTAAEALPPKERILDAASELFYRHGIRAVGVDAIAEAAGTNKMTLYRHFPSKDVLVAECMRRLGAAKDAEWDALAERHKGDPEGEIQAILEYTAAWLAKEEDRGCALANAAVELPEKDHPAKVVIETYKNAHRERLLNLFRAAGLERPEELTDEVFLMIEGARINIQSVGHEGPASRLVRILKALIEEHRPKQAATSG